MRSRAFLLAAILVAVACDRPSLYGTAAASDEARFARETLALLLAGDLDAMRARMSPNAARQATPAACGRMLAERPPGSPTGEPKLVRFDQVVSTEERRADFTFEYAYPAGYLLAAAVVDSSGPTPVVTGVHLKRMTVSVERLNAFGLRGRTTRHYTMLAAVLMVPALIVYALVACVRTPGLRYRPAWLAFILFGIGVVTLNWSTGRLAVRPSVQVLGASASRNGPYGPWLMTSSLPVGALAFLALRRRLVAGGGSARE
jgi:hypothetical protein